MNDFSGLLSLEEMEFFPNLDLCLPQCDDGTNDDVFQIVTKNSENFSTGEILQELDLEGGDQLLGTDWFTEKLDFNSFDPSELTGITSTLQEFTQDSSFCGTTFPDLNDEFLIPLPEDNITIPAKMPTTPEQKVPEYQALSPYSTSSEGSSRLEESNPSSPCSSDSDSSNDSTVCLKDLLSTDVTKTQYTKVQEKSPTQSRSKRATPYDRRSTSPQPTKRVKTPAQKQRKRVQNKDAATRYRVKKRSEQDLLFDAAEKAEKENNELKEQVASINKEIEYLKNLMIEVYKTKQKQQKTH